MNFFKKLFEFLLHKEHTINKKVHRFGAVIVTACLIGFVILGVNGMNSMSNQNRTVEEQNQMAKEEEQNELELVQEEQEDLTLQIKIPTYHSSYMKEYIDHIASLANTQAVSLTVSDKENMSLSTASLDANNEDGLVLISADDVDVTPNRDPIPLTENDYEVLLRIVEAEVGTEDLNLRMMIANTIINRMQNDYYPDTIKEVVFQNNGKVYQFSPILDGRYWKVQVSAKTIEAVNNALAGYDNSDGSLAFVNRSITSPKIMKWFDNNLIFVKKYGVVEFFTF